MDKRTPFRASLVAAALASVAGYAVAEVRDIRGSSVTSNTGECIQSTQGVVNCEPIASPTVPPEAVILPAPTPRSEIAALTPGEPLASTPREGGYVIDNSGDALRSNSGDCVSDITGAVDYGLPQCGGMLARAPIPVVPAQVQPELPTAPPAELAEPQPRVIPLRRITLDTDTTFNFDSAELTERGTEQLDDVVEAAQRENVARLRIHVTGYADRIGPEEYNQELSEERAEAVRQYFVDAGLPADVITTEGRGESNPVVQCEGMSGISLVECLRPNRRSEVEFAALERVEPDAAQEEPAPQRPWAPGTDTGTPR